jgi:hypothetical protein
MTSRIVLALLILAGSPVMAASVNPELWNAYVQCRRFYLVSGTNPASYSRPECYKIEQKYNDAVGGGSATPDESLIQRMAK